MICCRLRLRSLLQTFGPATRLFPVAAFAGLVLGAASCGPQCRQAEVRPLQIQCDLTSGFVGEVHFDSAATFDTFLRQECMLSAGESEISTLMDAVNFDSESVFVAVGPDSLDATRCLESRELEQANVCSDGLKLSFRDTPRALDGGTCPATDWTVAFVIGRDDLRTALDAAEAQ